MSKRGLWSVAHGLALRPRRRYAAVLVVLLCLGLMPASGRATVIVGSPLTHSRTGNTSTNAPRVYVQTVLPVPGARLASPVDGTVIRWRMRGRDSSTNFNTFALRVMRPAGGGTFTGAGSSALQTLSSVGSDDTLRTFDTSLPIRAGDQIGIDADTNTTVPSTPAEAARGSVFSEFADGMPSGASLGTIVFTELLFNAEVVAAPTTTAQVASCSQDGRVPVSVSTDPATTAYAVHFRVDGGGEQVIPAPSGQAAVTIPAGRHALEYWGQDQVPQQEVQHHSATVMVGGCSSTSRARLTVTGLKVTPSVWRLGSLLPRLSRARRPPVGTIVGYTLSAPARVTIAFSQPKTGRRVGRRCLAQTRTNKRRPKCTIPNVRGALAFNGHAGADKVKFQGRLSRTKRLKPGRYTLTMSAADTAGNRSTSKSTSFTIVR